MSESEITNIERALDALFRGTGSRLGTFGVLGLISALGIFGAPSNGFTATPNRCVRHAIVDQLIDPLPPLKGAPITKNELEIIRKHPIAKFAAKYQDTPVIFESVLFGEMDPFYKGEWLQAQFVKDVLKKLFPKARFVKQVKKAAPDAVIFKININDPLEQYLTPKELKSVLSSGDSIPMHMIKPLGSRQKVELSKEQIRESLGIAPDQKVVSLYIRAPGTLYDYSSRAHSRYNEYQELIEGIAKGLDFDVVILSFGNIQKGASGVQNDFARYAGDYLNRIKDASELLANPGKIPGKTLIYNDTYGKMPYMHRAADLSVVVGPVNFFEPVAAGTRTVLIKKTGSVTRGSNYAHYDEATLETLAELAQKGGGFESVREYSELPAAITKLKTQAPGSTESIANTVYPAFLDHLEKHLKAALKAPGQLQ